METQIKAGLITLLDGIKQADAAAILSATRALDGQLAAARGQLDPQLTHFLERRSYAKALQWLGGAEDIPTGACGGREKP